MSDYTLKNGVRRVVASVPQEDNSTENTVTVVLSGGTVPWILRFWARFGTRRAYVGSVRTFASKLNRVVAVCSMPGATAWEVEGQANEATAVDEVGIHFEGSDALGGPWGVSALPGFSVDGARSYRLLTGVAGVVVVTGEVYGWAAESGAGGTITVAAGPSLSFGPLVVPAGIPVHGDARGLLAPVSTWTFVGTDHYFLEYVPPGIVFDG